MAQRAILCFLCQSVKSVDSLPGLSSYRKRQIFSLRSLPSLRLRVTSAADSPRAEQLLLRFVTAQSAAFLAEAE